MSLAYEEDIWDMVDISWPLRGTEPGLGRRLSVGEEVEVSNTERSGRRGRAECGILLQEGAFRQ